MSWDTVLSALLKSMAMVTVRFEGLSWIMLLEIMFETRSREDVGGTDGI